ncbi:Sulfur carrier protein ThiS adenylyltransferase [Lacunisphaera limnophila]|uniref:Molybdopterin synthase catalytic subunit n=1 Tax=Lacunisphaera limnophila TaxID=1838286 RepID=A0A1D8AV31_9BACT|nr:ThiF family adenylyltransferase [Lacunisphaera limnophila]AOS44757.1 Sulfur carrier protein ThiS adenylyltransferase [Lacunisphaera limnophila]
MFELTATPIDPAALSARLNAPEAGALTIFEGRVRNHHLGQPVTHLEYEAFDDLARLEGEAITAETERIYPGTKVLCVHRTGSLAIGEAAVWIGIASAHRQAGFAACRHVIEELKLRLPVWKKEHHPGGAAEWVNCTAEAAARPATDEMYARQAALPEVGTAGQAKLSAARVLVVGVGGLGCPAALYLAGAGLGRLTLVDGGKVERSNLPRQILFTTAELGAPKALAAAARLRLHNPSVQITSHEGDLTSANARALVAGHDVVLDCTDNFTSRFLLHDTCLALGVPLVSAAVHRFEGTLDVFTPGVGGCLHCQWTGRNPGELDSAGNCAGGPVFGPAVGVLGVMQAAEAIKLILGLAGDAPRQSRLVNLLDGSQLSIAREPRPDCPVCSRLDTLKAVPPVAVTDTTLFLDPARIASVGPTAQTVYLTEPGETAPAGMTSVPALDLARLRELATAGPLVLTCRYGVRSAALARLLRTEGNTQVFALTTA